MERDEGRLQAEAHQEERRSEEERRVANLPSFAIRALELLAEVRSDVKTDLERARSTPERALDILLEAGDRVPDRQVLFLLDNFDELVIAAVSGRGRRFDAKQMQPVVRMERLLRSPRFLVVATALQSPERRKDFPRPLLDIYREAVVDKKLGRELRNAVTRVMDKGYPVGAKHYKRIPRGYDESHPNAEFLLFNGLHAVRDEKIPKQFYSEAIIDYAFSHYKNMAPIHRWLKNVLEN